MDLKKTADSLKKRGYEVSCFSTAKEAAEYLNEKIDGKTVGFGDSETLLSMHLFEILQTHNDVYHPMFPREGKGFYSTARDCLTTEIFLLSANGLAETGEIVNIDGTGNRIAGSLAVRLGVDDGFRPANTIVDLRYNNDELEDPFINRDHAVALGLATYRELDGMYDIARKANDLLKELFHRAGIELVDMKIEFGRASDNGDIIISDEISPDTCRLWDEESGERLDKDRFRLDLGDVTESYRTVLERLENVLEIDEEE